MTRVLLADDQHLVRGALAALLSLEDDIEVPGLDGLAVASALALAMPVVRVIIVTTFGRPGYL